MTENTTFYRKIVYVVLIAALLFPISHLGSPATAGGNDGGMLAQLRAKHDLGQSSLGEIDPASETMRLATLGLRGVAVSMLWNQANEYKKKEDWTNFRATLDQLAKLQPYFIKFWQYQAWNLTYNVSVELDDVRDRFHYVKRGIQFLEKGIKYNRDSAYLLSELGWFVGNKIGRADEKKDYRRLFKADEDFHKKENRPLEARDNWLVSREWYDKAISAVDDKKKSLGKKNPTTFYSNPGRSQINYGEAIEEDGVFGEKARSAWITAARLWKDFGDRPLKSSYAMTIRLGDVDRFTAVTDKLQASFEDLDKDARAEVLALKQASLTPEQQAVLSLAESELTEAQAEVLRAAEEHLDISTEDLALHLEKHSPQLASKARKLATKLARNRHQIRLTHINRGVVAYGYWKMRCDLEQMPEALRAHDLAYSAQRAFKVDADLVGAKELFEESFDQWAIALAAFPEMEVDSPTGADIMEVIKQYAVVLEQLDMSMSDDEIGSKFPLWDIVAANDDTGNFLEAASKFNSSDDSKNKSSSESHDPADHDHDHGHDHGDHDHDDHKKPDSEATAAEKPDTNEADTKEPAQESSADEAATEEAVSDEAMSEKQEETSADAAAESAEESEEAATDSSAEAAIEEAVETEASTAAESEAA